MTSRTILVYHPEMGAEPVAATYGRLVERPRSVELATCWTPEAAEAAIGGAEILFAWNFPARLLARAPRLRWIQSMGAGVERFIVPELPPGVTLTRAAGVFGPWMAEYTIGWCLWVTQRIRLFESQQRERRWAPVDPQALRGRTLCIVGLGDIGRHIARAARGLGMRVIGVTRRGQPVAGASRIYRPRSIRTALAAADFAVLTVPLHAETRSLIGEAELAVMKPSAWLINMARGPVVDEAALLSALRGHRIGGAVLDVFDTEPLPADHPLWQLDNVAITPHIAGPSTPPEIAPIFNDNLRRYLAGRRLRHVVDPARGY